MKNSIILSIVTALIVGITGVCAEEPATNGSQEKSAVSTFRFTDSNGNEIEFSENSRGFVFPAFKNKQVIMMFYLASGTPCQNELHIFEEIKKEIKDLEIVTFELKGLDTQQLKNFIKEHKLEDLHMIEAKQSISFAKHIMEVAGWRGSVPLIIIVDGSGIVKYSQIGAMSKEELLQKLK